MPHKMNPQTHVAYRPLSCGLRPKICPELKQSLEPNDAEWLSLGVALAWCSLTLSEGGDGNQAEALGLALTWEMGP